MLVIIGTVPDPSFPLISAQATLQDEQLLVQGQSIPVHRGTPALIAAAAQIALATGQPAPHAILVGDTGLGNGSRKLYAHLTDHIRELGATSIVFHYLQPDVDWHNRVLMAIEDGPTRPRLIADAGFMYAAKMSGLAGSYDLFTPDMGELAFLADETAPHPFYTRGFILHDDNKAPDLITRAYAHDNAAKNLLVKGATDMFASAEGVHWTIDSPSAEAMEAMGGTGDTLTGIASLFVDMDIPIEEACKKAAMVNRWAGKLTQPTPATQVMEIIRDIPEALGKI